MPNLVYLDLQNSKLTGGIPETFGFNENWEEINLSDNLLNGTIPNSICNILDLYDSGNGLSEGRFVIEDNFFCPDDFPWCFFDDTTTIDRNGERDICPDGAIEDDCGECITYLDNQDNPLFGCFWQSGQGPIIPNDLQIEFNDPDMCFTCTDQDGTLTGQYRCNEQQCNEVDYIAPDFMKDAVEEQTCEFGCTDPFACPESYNPDATEDDGSCEYDDGCGCDNPNTPPTPIQCWDSGTGDEVFGVEACPTEDCTNATVGGDESYSNNPPVFGCTDELACNYDENAQVDDNSCYFPQDYGWCNCDGDVIDSCGNCLPYDDGCHLPDGPYNGCVQCEAVGENGEKIYGCGEYQSGVNNECPQPEGVFISEWGIFYPMSTTFVSRDHIGENGVAICDSPNGLAYGNRIPFELGQLVNLQEINLSECNLQGDIPSELGNLTNLIEFILDNNQLTGEIPASFASLDNLSAFDVSTNLLSRPIDEAFCNLLYLGELYNDGGYLNPNDFEIDENKFCPQDFPSCFFGNNNPLPPDVDGRDECQAGQVEDDCGQCQPLNESSGDTPGQNDLTNQGCWYATGPSGTGTAPVAPSYDIGQAGNCHTCVDSNGYETGFYACNAEDCPIPDYEVPAAMLDDYEDQDCILGCTDNTACNYDEQAFLYGEDDGTCWWHDPGCVCQDGEGAIPDCSGYCYVPGLEEPLHTLDCSDVCSDDIEWIGDQGDNGVDLCGVCDGIIYEESDCLDDPGAECCGCTDDGALNYNENATIDDGTCEYVEFWGMNWSLNVTHIPQTNYETQIMCENSQLLGEQIPEEICLLTNLEEIDLRNCGLTGFIPDCLWTALPKLYSIRLNRYDSVESFPEDHPYGIVFPQYNESFPDNTLTGQLPPEIGYFGAFGSGELSWPSSVVDLGGVGEFGIIGAHLDLEYNQFYGPIPDDICRIYEEFYSSGSYPTIDPYWSTQFNFDNNNFCEIYYVNPGGAITGFPYCLTGQFTDGTPFSPDGNQCNDCIDILACNYNDTAVSGVNNCYYGGQCPGGEQVCDPATDCDQFVGCMDSLAGNYDSGATVPCNGTNHGNNNNINDCEEDLIGTDNCCCDYTYCPDGFISFSFGVYSYCISQDLYLDPVFSSGYIDLSFSGLTGPIPQTVNQFQNLFGLTLSNNSISGPLPNSWPSPAQLEILDLSTNEIWGIIPQEIFELESLTTLNLGGSPLSTTGNLIGLDSVGNGIDSGGYGQGYSLVNDYDICNSPFVQNITGPDSLTLGKEINQFTGQLLGGNYICPPYPACIIGPDYGLDKNYQILSKCISANVEDWGCIDDGNLQGDALTLWNQTYESKYGSYLGVRASNYNSNAQFDDGSCIYESGCADDGNLQGADLDEWNQIYNSDGNFEYPNIQPCNYDPNASTLDDSCEYPIVDDLGNQCDCQSTYPLGYDCGIYVSPQTIVCEPQDCPAAQCVANDIDIFGTSVSFDVTVLPPNLPYNGQIPPQIQCFPNLERLILNLHTNRYDYDPFYDPYGLDIPSDTNLLGYQILPPEEQWRRVGISGVLMPHIGSLGQNLIEIDVHSGVNSFSNGCGSIEDDPFNPVDPYAQCPALFPLSYIPHGMFDTIENLESINLSNSGLMGEIPPSICNTRIFDDFSNSVVGEGDLGEILQNSYSNNNTKSELRRRVGFRNAFLNATDFNTADNPAEDGEDIYFATGPGRSLWDWTSEENLDANHPYIFGYAMDTSTYSYSDPEENPQYHWSWGNKLCPLGPTLKLNVMDYSYYIIGDEDSEVDGYGKVNDNLYNFDYQLENDIWNTSNPATPYHTSMLEIDYLSDPDTGKGAEWCAKVCNATPMLFQQQQYLETIGVSVDDYIELPISVPSIGLDWEERRGLAYISHHWQWKEDSIGDFGNPWNERDLICECGVYPPCMHNTIRYRGFNSYSQVFNLEFGYEYNNPFFTLMGIQSGFYMENLAFSPDNLNHPNYGKWYSFCQGGCTNPEACNYVPPTGYEPEYEGLVHIFNDEYYDGLMSFPAWHPFKEGNFISYDDGSCILPEDSVLNCYLYDEEPAECNLSTAEGGVGKFWTSTYQITGCDVFDGTAECPFPYTEDPGDGPRVYGCTDPSAINYYNEANCDPGFENCEYFDEVLDFGVPGVEIKQSFFEPYDAFSGMNVFYVNNQDVENADIYGCTDESAYNYNELATIDFGCQYRHEGAVEFKVNDEGLFECRNAYNEQGGVPIECDNFDRVGFTVATCANDEGGQDLQSVEECCLIRLGTNINPVWTEDYNCYDLPLYTGTEFPNENFMNDLENLTVIECPEQENIYQCWRTESLPPSLRERVEEEELDEYEETGVLPFENTIEGWENSNTDGRPPLGCFYFDDRNQSSTNFNLLTDDKFSNYEKPNLLNNGDGFSSIRTLSGDTDETTTHRFRDPHFTNDYWNVYLPDGGWEHVRLRGNFWNTFENTGGDHYLDLDEYSNYYNSVVENDYDLNPPSPLTQVDNSLMWAGGINYLYPYRIFTTEPYNLHTYAEWVIDPECYSYQKCLIFETKRPQEHPYSPSSGLSGTIENCLEATTEENCLELENYPSLNQAQTILTSVEANQLLRRYNSMRVSFWMKTTRKDNVINEITEVTSKTPQVEVGLVPNQLTQYGDEQLIDVERTVTCGGCVVTGNVEDINGQRTTITLQSAYGCDEAENLTDQSQPWLQDHGAFVNHVELGVQNNYYWNGVEDVPAESYWNSLNLPLFEPDSGAVFIPGQDLCGSFDNIRENTTFRFGVQNCRTFPDDISDWFYFQTGELDGEFICDNDTISDLFPDINFDESDLCPDTDNVANVCQRLKSGVDLPYNYRASGHYNSEISENILENANLSPRGATGRFQNSELNKWEKFEFTFNLSDDFYDFENESMRQISFITQWGNYSSGRIYLDNFEVSEAGDFLPDVDVRTKNSFGEYGVGRLTEYYDPDLQSEEYKSTTAPLEAQFYFYPRYPYNEVFYTDRPIMYTAFRQNEFYLYDVDWGDGSPSEFIEPELINENKSVYHTYLNSGIYEVTGYMLRVKIDEFGNPSGVLHNQRFTVRINVNKGTDEDFLYFGSDGFSFIPFENTTPIIGGISEQSSYYKNIVRQLGFLDSSEDDFLKVNVPFDKISDKLKTESALIKMDSSYEEYLDVLPNFTRPRYLLPDSDAEDNTLINNGTTLLRDELGKSIGDTDVTNVRWFNEPKQMWEMLGFPSEKDCVRIEFSLDETFGGDGDYYSPNDYFFYIVNHFEDTDIEFQGYINPMSVYDCDFDFSDPSVYTESLSPITSIRAICEDGTEVEIVKNFDFSDLNYPHDCFDCFQYAGVSESVCLDEGSQYGCGFNYQTFPPCYCENSSLGCCTDIDAIWKYNSGVEACGKVDDYNTSLENPGNPLSPRYWKNIIPDYYTFEEHIGVPESFETRRQTNTRSKSNVDIKKIENQIRTQSKENLTNVGNRYYHEPTGWQYSQTTSQSFLIFSTDFLNLDITLRVGDVIAFFYTKVDGVLEPEEVVAGYGIVDSQIYNDFPESIFVVHIVLDDGSGYINTNTDLYPDPGSSFYELGQLQGGHFKYYNSQTGEIGKFVNSEMCNYFNELQFENNLIEVIGIDEGTDVGTWTVDYSGATVEELCSSSTDMTIDIPTWGATLVSFPLIMENNSLEDIFGLDGTIYSITTEEQAATLMDDIGWAGSLTEINPLKGYWVYNSDEEGTTIDIEGELVGNPTYELNPGTQPTLISYPFLHSQEPGCTLDGLENIITAIIGQGVAALYNPETGWTGSIESFEPGTAYWVKHKSGAPTEFNWNQCLVSSSATINEFNFRFPKNWHEMGINNVFEELESQAPTMKKILVNRILKKQRRL